MTNFQIELENLKMLRLSYTLIKMLFQPHNQSKHIPRGGNSHWASSISEMKMKIVGSLKL